MKTFNLHKYLCMAMTILGLSVSVRTNASNLNLKNAGSAKSHHKLATKSSTQRFTKKKSTSQVHLGAKKKSKNNSPPSMLPVEPDANSAIPVKNPPPAPLVTTPKPKPAPVVSAPPSVPVIPPPAPKPPAVIPVMVPTNVQPPVETSNGSGTLSIPVGTTWYWQLQGTVNTTLTAKVYDIDLFNNTASSFAALKQQGHIVICYFSAGTYENWRDDATQFQPSVLGSAVDGWPGENWLDVRSSNVRDIMAKRLDIAKSKGCDGVEPDNVDGYSNNSGFPLTSLDQINFNTYLADQAHARGLIIALKNSTDLVSSLVNKFDFAVVEQCAEYSECDAYSPFVKQNKAVLIAEYTKYSASVCTQSSNQKFSTVFFNLDLNGSLYKPCP